MTWASVLARLGVGSSEASTILAASATKAGVVDRRAFLGLLAGGVAGTVVAASVDLEALIWTPKSIIVVPAMPGTHDGITPQWINREIFKRLRNQMALWNHVNSQCYDKAFLQTSQWSEGEIAARVLLPQRYDLR